MPASKRWSGSAKKARETWLVAHMRRSASATKPWKAGAVCATSDRVGRKTASVSSENPARTSSGTALLGIHLEIAEAAVEPVDGEAKELRRHGGAEDEREAGIGCLLDQGANIGKGYEVPRKRRPGGPVERALEAQGRGDHRIAAAQPQDHGRHPGGCPEVEVEAGRLAGEKRLPAMEERDGIVPGMERRLEVAPVPPARPLAGVDRARGGGGAVRGARLPAGAIELAATEVGADGKGGLAEREDDRIVARKRRSEGRRRIVLEGGDPLAGSGRKRPEMDDAEGDPEGTQRRHDVRIGEARELVHYEGVERREKAHVAVQGALPVRRRPVLVDRRGDEVVDRQLDQGKVIPLLGEPRVDPIVLARGCDRDRRPGRSPRLEEHARRDHGGYRAARPRREAARQGGEPTRGEHRGTEEPHVHHARGDTKGVVARNREEEGIRSSQRSQACG